MKAPYKQPYRLSGAFPPQGATPTLGTLRRSTLVLLRWMAVLGQSLALLIIGLVFKFSYPVLPCFAVIGASVIFNIIMTLSNPLDRRVSSLEGFLQLAFDVLQLAALLWLTGGIANPFAILFIAPIVTAATTLSLRVLLSLSALALVLSLGLVFHHCPLPWTPAGAFTLPLVFRLGIWAAIFIGAGFTSLYAWRTTRESQKMSQALAVTEAMLAQEQKLSALGGLAAAAAHELGTPLSTIQLVASEMSRELDPQTLMGEDAALILSQAQRCRDILGGLAERGDEGDIIHDQLSLEDLLEEAAEPFFGRGKDIRIQLKTHKTNQMGTKGDLRLRRQPGLLHALKNYIDNGVDFAQSQVTLSAYQPLEKPDSLVIIIEDDGPGFSPAILERLGQPYMSERLRQKKSGRMGLGIFISKTLIERMGGALSYQNRHQGGAQIQVVLPLDEIT